MGEDGFWDEHKAPTSLTGIRSLHSILWTPWIKSSANQSGSETEYTEGIHGPDVSHQPRRSESTSAKANILELVFYTNH
ncbi:hypothetical protein GCM10025751_45670 [Haladaptatus pallidirubidus]|uniref:Uncharacterized protein n=1 Tax=Haladaptatus pallidirubidus TaxID=1008152 RepID=A0AAV3UNH3_9EURY